MTELRQLQGAKGSLLQKTFYLLYDDRVVKRHLQTVAMSGGMKLFCDGAAACICKGHWKFLSIQFNGSQIDICRDVFEADGERALLKNCS